MKQELIKIRSKKGLNEKKTNLHFNDFKLEILFQSRDNDRDIDEKREKLFSHLQKLFRFNRFQPIVKNKSISKKILTDINISYLLSSKLP